MADEDFEMIPVTSSQLASVGYNPDMKKMRVEFANSSVYEYDGVTQDVFDGLISAPSAGQFFNARVKWSFPYQRLS